MTGRYKTYPEYKDSGSEWVGNIPVQWETTKLKYIFDIQKRIAGEVGYDVLSITQRGIKVKDIESGDGQLSMDYSKYQLVYKGDFAMNHMDLLTGYVDISSFDGVTSPDYRVFRLINCTRFYDRYYLYLLQFCYKQKVFFPLGQGSAHLGRWRLPTEAFNEVEYPTPSFSEQQQIANFLDYETAKIDTLIDKQEKLIELLKEKRQAVISHAMTKGLSPDAKMKDSGVEWLGSVPEHWKGTALKYITNIYGRIGFRGYTTNDIVEEGNGAITMSPSNISNGVVSFDKATYISWEKYYESPEIQLQKDDVVLVKTGSTLGKAGYIDKLICPTTLNPQLAVFKESSCCNKWLYYFLNTTLAKAYVNNSNSGGTVPTMSQEKILSYIAPTPPLKEQGEIAAYLDLEISKIDDLITKMNTMVDLINERKTALISAAVTGKIDVRDWQESEQR
ncbi:restriction endonuclease subunit S [Vibrio parahaemolyticus]|uniref:restriction endonuclease subunit S n=1 Tax=Vibrio parahaemolyticus TaxID=670 RepID=UPI001EEBC830|nr:restriction endonuclease subunit S [Vibrio parahaemolyticus]